MNKILNHSIEQQRLFFALCRQYGYNKEEAMEHARKRYNKEHIGELSSDEIGAVIDLMKDKNKESDPVIEFIAYDNVNKRIFRVMNIDLWEDGVNEVTEQYEIDGKGSNFTDKHITILQFTGKRDYFGAKLYRSDVFEDRNKEQWMVEWSNKYYAWIVYNVQTDQIKFLHTFSIVKKIGNVYTGVKGGEKNG